MLAERSAEKRHARFGWEGSVAQAEHVGTRNARDEGAEGLHSVL